MPVNPLDAMAPAEQLVAIHVELALMEARAVEAEALLPRPKNLTAGSLLHFAENYGKFPDTLLGSFAAFMVMEARAERAEALLPKHVAVPFPIAAPRTVAAPARHTRLEVRSVDQALHKPVRTRSMAFLHSPMNGGFPLSAVS